MMPKTDAHALNEVKAVALEVKADKEGRVEGYASKFNEVDRGGDIVLPGAFAKTLITGRRIKMLWQHDPNEPLGTWDDVAEDQSGLYVRGQVLTSLAKGAEVLSMIKAGVIDGLSIGYRTVRAIKGDTGARMLQELDLWEVSMVTFPMLESTRIDAVKAVELSERDLERKLTRDAGFSRSVALALMGGGYDAVKAMRDAGDDGLSELARHMRQTMGKGD
jgi:HK97 family phage prohead protease